MKNISMLILKGMAMGSADVVPGVSGGTIALLTGIYPRLINAIASVNVNSMRHLFKGHIKQFWKDIDGNFIAPLLLGIMIAFALFAHSIKYAIEFHPIPTWAFFFGLIIASAVLIIKHIPNKLFLNYFWILPGIFAGYWIGSQTSIAFPNNEIAIFIAGMIAICAMILPGISGSFILVLLGMYQVLITAVTERNYSILLIFVVGAIIGLLIFSRVLKIILAKFYQVTLFFLSGLMLGSLVKVWPWKAISELSLDPKHPILLNISPFDYPNPSTNLALLMTLLAIVLVFLVDYLGSKFNKE
jgi:putative membrane protein